MIDPETATRARSILSNAIVELVEDEHVGIVSVPTPGGDEAHAKRLRLLGSDIAILASAMAVILRRSREGPDAEA